MNPQLAEFVATSRLHYLAPLSVLFLLANFFTRIVFQLAFPVMTPFLGDMAVSLPAGILNDLATLSFVMLLPATLLLMPKDSFINKIAGKGYALVIYFLFSSIFIFTAFAEFFFWDEFRSRFNFIAVDYLIYTSTLARNVIESYPLGWLLFSIFLLSLITTIFMWKILYRIQKKLAEASYFKKRLIFLGGLYITAILVFVFFTPFSPSQNRFWNEYAKNGAYEIFSAYLNNQLDYRAFYKTMDQNDAFSLMRSKIKDAGNALASPHVNNLIHIVEPSLHEKMPNVIIVVMESMGIKALGEYTPNLNALAGEGLTFTQMMSTGTRTVRGLEAIMLSIPPTPGNSIVRRPDNDHLFNLGTVFRNRGYDLSFIYGGIGFFDNMNAFFANNRYDVTDRLSFYPENKTFANAWGQCDEDLYAQSLAQADHSHAAGKFFKQVLLTTSNHRPFTYPAGKVSLESGSGRRGAIQYSDYAIGKFLRQAKTKPWFGNTVFIFVGDHPSSVAGKTEVPADAYCIVCIMYGPQFFKPEKIDTLCSQIDLAPTLLASLGWGYASQFFGADARALPINKGRAWISTYQFLGFRTNDSLVVLKPGDQVEVTKFQHFSKPDEIDEAVVSWAVASYQCAYDLFVNKQLKEDSMPTYMPENSRR